jgi:hypothetical protein
MNLINQIFTEVISEQEQPPKGRKTSPLVDAITNRHPITFYYSGPKETVLSGVRVRAEAVAMGLSKGGNVIIRAFVLPPSVSKKGFKPKRTQNGEIPANHWRTFRVDRMSNIKVITDVVFNEKRPGYNEGPESKQGPMVTTYVTSNWTDTPEIKKPEPVVKSVEPTIEPKQPEDTLPQPKVDDKPTPTPQEEPKDFSKEVFDSLQKNLKDVNGEKTITTQDFQNSSNELYKLKEKDWIENQRQLGKNINPGSGTRRRFEMSSKSELSDLLSKNNIKINDNDTPEIEDTTELQESIKRIKTLMFG